AGRRATSVEALTGRWLERETAGRDLAPQVARSLDLELRWGDPTEFAGLPAAPPEPERLPHEVRVG
ncbi:MAG: hypothetical protein J2P38_00330, partial [Candidatus Dormibacteraeota bacterium]|nr:hypothetical protein [Candidatus Dormibacteraeota bacterium]